jgi:hypothetical protein
MHIFSDKPLAAKQRKQFFAHWSLKETAPPRWLVQFHVQISPFVGELSEVPQTNCLWSLTHLLLVKKIYFYWWHQWHLWFSLFFHITHIWLTMFLWILSCCHPPISSCTRGHPNQDLGCIRCIFQASLLNLLGNLMDEVYYGLPISYSLRFTIDIYRPWSNQFAFFHGLTAVGFHHGMAYEEKADLFAREMAGGYPVMMFNSNFLR